MNKAYYANIPANVRYDDDLTANAKLLYGEITALSNELGYCWASNQYFAQLYKVHKNTISAWVSALHKKEYIFITMICRQDGSMERRISLNGKIGPPTQNPEAPLNEKLNHNTTINNTLNKTYEEGQNLSLPIIELEDKVPAGPTKKSRKTNLKKPFSESQFFQVNFITEYFQGTDLAQVKWEYYLPKIQAWSDKKNVKRDEQGWRDTIENWIQKDINANCLRTVRDIKPGEGTTENPKTLKGSEYFDYYGGLNPNFKQPEQ